jgi:hypothetical protein
MLGVALLGVCACGNTPDSMDPGSDPIEPPETLPEKPAEAPPIHFAAEIDQALAGTFATEFSIVDTVNVYAVVPVPRDNAILWLKVDVLLPAGGPYQTFWRAFSDDANAPATTTHPNLMGDAPVHRTVVIDGKGYLFVSIPIAGSDISRYVLTGRFPTEARLGMGEGPVTAAGAFTIVLPE